MREEYLDIVNDKDEVIGRDTRSNIHDKKLCHREIVIFIINDDGEILVQRRSLLKAVSPGKWSFPVAGHLDSGESYEATARREAEEELGIKIDNLELIGKEAPTSEDTENRFFTVYTTKHNGPFSIDKTEVEEVKFFKPDDLDRLVEEDPNFGSAFTRLYGKYRDKLVNC